MANMAPGEPTQPACGLMKSQTGSFVFVSTSLRFAAFTRTLALVHKQQSLYTKAGAGAGVCLAQGRWASGYSFCDADCMCFVDKPVL